MSDYYTGPTYTVGAQRWKDDTTLIQTLVKKVYKDGRLKSVSSGGEFELSFAHLLKTAGPGTNLKRLLATFGFVANAACPCNALLSQMDKWGVEGCRIPANREKILTEMKGVAAYKGFVARVTASFSLPALYDLSVSQAEQADKAGA